MSDLPLIEVRHLVKQFGERTILDGVDLTVHRGETVAIMGGSGSGKTTLARIVMGLERATSGEILLEGVDLASPRRRAASAMRRRFAMVFQGAALLDSMSAFDNVAFPLRQRRALDEGAIRERTLAQLRELGLEHAADRLPAQLSGGMAKRVGIARAMVMEPEIIVYDEPTSGLDPMTSRVVDALIDQMRERFFVTSLVITHDMVTAFEVADRIVLLAQGKVSAEGSPLTILHSHRQQIQPFATSSGVDLERHVPRAGRRSAAEIRAAWLAGHGG